MLSLQFAPAHDAASLSLTGEKTYSVNGLAEADEVPHASRAGPGAAQAVFGALTEISPMVGPFLGILMAG